MRKKLVDIRHPSFKIFHKIGSEGIKIHSVILKTRKLLLEEKLKKVGYSLLITLLRKRMIGIYIIYSSP